MKNFYAIAAMITIASSSHTQSSQQASKEEKKEALTYTEQGWQHNIPEAKQKKLFNCTLAWMSGEQPEITCQIRDFLRSLPKYEPDSSQEPARNVFLFYGEPGTGKTTGAMLMAESANVSIDMHKMDEFISKHGNDPVDEIKRIYKDAEETVKNTKKPVVIIFDDIKDEEKQKITLDILKNYLQDYSGNPYIMTILTTNRDVLVFDESFRSRCTLVHWPMPDDLNRFAIIYDAILKESPITSARFLKSLAKKTGNFTPRDLVDASQNTRIISKNKDVYEKEIIKSFKARQAEIDRTKSFTQRQLDRFWWMIGRRL